MPDFRVWAQREQARPLSLPPRLNRPERQFVFQQCAQARTAINSRSCRHNQDTVRSLSASCCPPINPSTILRSDSLFRACQRAARSQLPERRLRKRSRHEHTAHHRKSNRAQKSFTPHFSERTHVTVAGVHRTEVQRSLKRPLNDTVQKAAIHDWTGKPARVMRRALRRRRPHMCYRFIVWPKPDKVPRCFPFEAFPPSR